MSRGRGLEPRVGAGTVLNFGGAGTGPFLAGQGESGGEITPRAGL